MDALDVFLVIVIMAAAVRGLRRGAAVQVLSYGGALAGLAVGVALVLVVCPHLRGEHTKTIVALVLLLVPATVLAAGGRQLGSGVWHRLRRARFGAVDAVGGAIVATAGALVVIWLLASILVNSQFSLVANQINDSKIIRTVTNVMPPVPTALAPAERFLSDEGLQLVADGLIQLAGPVSYPSATQARSGRGHRCPVDGEGRCCRLRRGPGGLGIRGGPRPRRHQRSCRRGHPVDKGRGRTRLPERAASSSSTRNSTLPSCVCRVCRNRR